MVLQHRCETGDGWCSGIPTPRAFHPLDHLPMNKPCQLHVPDDLSLPVKTVWPPTLADKIHEVHEGDDPEEDDPKPTMGALKRRARRRQEEEDLKEFLLKRGFASINAPQNRTSSRRVGTWSTCFFGEREELYPIHAAALEGDLRMVTLLLQAGVDREQETSKGRTALDIAKRSVRCGGSHKDSPMKVELMQILQGAGIKTASAWSVRDLCSRVPNPEPCLRQTKRRETA
ncbi:unnamed protein product [Durusdinium trenchii]|uniref:Uncharacterized protein n=1 Tax=Durusdinium trenchii TaxID=1381693 RepID=A0ABP0KD82_9DINO